MNKRVILGGLVGGVVILAFSFSILLLLDGVLPALTSGSNLWMGLLPMMLAPVAGGFLSGLIGKPNPLQAGLIAGLLAGLIVFIGWVVYAGLSFEAILSGIVIVLLWVILARVMAGFTQPRKKA